MLSFEIGFWHPFGPHAGETADEILERKRREIHTNGWTLWSFQFRNSLRDWFRELEKAHPRSVVVFCSEGKGARAPKSITKECVWYTPVHEDIKRKIPSCVRVPHPVGKRECGSAFIVKNIIYPADIEPLPVEWFRAGAWQDAPLPTRPEYLIRSGGTHLIRPVRAVLELSYPFLAEVQS